MSAVTLTRLSINEMADFELLHVIDDNSGENTAHIAEVLECPKASVGQRLAWMKKMDLIELDTEGGWRLSRKGRAMFNGRGKTLMSIRDLSNTIAKEPTLRWCGRREFQRNLLQ